MRCINLKVYEWGSIPCGNCWPCRRNRQEQKAGLMAVEFVASRGRAFFATLTYAPANLPRTKGKRSIAVFSDNDLGIVPNVEKEHEHKPEAVTPWDDLPEARRSRWFDMMEEHHRDSIIMDIKRKLPALSAAWANPKNDADEQSASAVEDMIDSRLALRMEQLQEPVAVVDTAPGAPTIDRAEYNAFVRRLKARMKRRGYSISVYGVGEYGDQGDRPHYHANIFVYAVDESVAMPKSVVELLFDVRQQVHKAWKRGRTQTKMFHPGSPQYAAKYLALKFTGPLATRSFGDHSKFYRPDGSAQCFSVSHGVGYKMFGAFRDYYQCVSAVVNSMTLEQVEAVTDFRSKQARGIPTDKAIGKINKLGIQIAHIHAVTQLGTMMRGRIALHLPEPREKGRLIVKEYYMPNFWRRKLVESFDAPEGTWDKIREMNAEVSAMIDRETTPAMLEVQARKDKARASKDEKQFWKASKQQKVAGT